MCAGKSFRLSANNHGFIIIPVLISVTLLLTAALAFAWYARTEIQRTEAEKNIIEARNVAEIACSLIAEKIAADKNGYDSRTEPLYRNGDAVRIIIGDYEVRAYIVPLDDKIPVKGIFLPDGVTIRQEYAYAWDRIWKYVGLPVLSNVALDFMDKDNSQKLGGAERTININRPVSDITELKIIPEISGETLNGTKEAPGGLNKYLTVYGNDKININTAAPEVIALLDERIDPANAELLAAARNRHPIKNLDDLKRIQGFPNSTVAKIANILGFESNYFCLNMKIIKNAARERNFRVILQRNGDSCKIARWEE